VGSRGIPNKNSGAKFPEDREFKKILGNMDAGILKLNLKKHNARMWTILI
jgi:hypothetical protein